ncbi:MAG: hypothetical protein QG549_914 [Patescibacteria group bacterium]|nr:hypothetical protein [Patescibacteria group bacterium]
MTYAAQQQIETYNGRSNYQTWLVGSWLDNDEFRTDNILDVISSLDTPREQAKELEFWVRENIVESTASLQTDLLNSALDDVNWLEIIEANQE